jgi:hypothetical protein
MSAEILPAALLKRKAVVYVRQSTQTLLILYLSITSFFRAPHLKLYHGDEGFLSLDLRG